jgi:21S rRNA (uridine2791-2'-O)-methyltransferase
VCKFYQGAEDKALEMLLKKMFAKVHREKPESSRSVRFVTFSSFLCCIKAN